MKTKTRRRPTLHLFSGVIDIPSLDGKCLNDKKITVKVDYVISKQIFKNEWCGF
jgi:hypothetical protein